MMPKHSLLPCYGPLSSLSGFVPTRPKPHPKKIFPSVAPVYVPEERCFSVFCCSRQNICNPQFCTFSQVLLGCFLMFVHDPRVSPFLIHSTPTPLPLMAMFCVPHSGTYPAIASRVQARCRYVSLSRRFPSPPFLRTPSGKP